MKVWTHWANHAKIMIRWSFWTKYRRTASLLPDISPNTLFKSITIHFTMVKNHFTRIESLFFDLPEWNSSETRALFQFCVKTSKISANDFLHLVYTHLNKLNVLDNIFDCVFLNYTLSRKNICFSSKRRKFGVLMFRNEFVKLVSRISQAASCTLFVYRRVYQSIFLELTNVSHATNDFL